MIYSVDSPGDLPHVLAGAGQEDLQAVSAPLRHPGAAVEYEDLQGRAGGQQSLDIHKEEELQSGFELLLIVR